MHDARVALRGVLVAVIVGWFPTGVDAHDVEALFRARVGKKRQIYLRSQLALRRVTGSISRIKAWLTERPLLRTAALPPLRRSAAPRGTGRR